MAPTPSEPSIDEIAAREARPGRAARSWGTGDLEAPTPGVRELLARVALDEVPDYVAVLDTEGCILALNRSAEALTGAAHGAMLGVPIWTSPPFEHTPEASERIKRCCERALHGEPARDEIDLARVHGTSPDGDAPHGHAAGDHASGPSGDAAPVVSGAEYDPPLLTGTIQSIPTKFTVRWLRGTAGGDDCLVVQGRDVSVQALSDQLIEDLRRERDALRQRVRELQPVPRPGAPPAATSAYGSALPLARPRVLVVEDNPAMNRFLTEALSRSFDVDSALDGAAGLALATAAPPDLILTDLMMPRMNGDALVRELRTLRAMDDVPIVLLTAKADDELRVRLLREGAQDYLAKPFSAKELLIRVGNLVDVKRTRQVLREEVATQGRSLESLARALTTRSRELESALEATRVAREHAEREGEAKNLFLSVASHELRTPIAALQLRLDRLRRSLSSSAPHEHDDTFRGVQRSIDRLTTLVESLLEYSKVQSSVIPVDPEIFDVRGVLDEILEELRERAEAKGLPLGYLRPAQPVRVQTDAGLLRIVLANLLENALKFTDQGQIDVSIEQDQTSIRISVRDTGPGIPPEERTRIFEPFAHVESADKKHTPGVGLGLALVREVTTALHGSVELESEVGRGSTFSVLLPVAGHLGPGATTPPWTGAAGPRARQAGR